VVIADYLKEFAGLTQKTVVAGMHNRLEIWDEARWQSYKEGVEKQADALAEKLAEIGMF
jgi:MraZ protein